MRPCADFLTRPGHPRVEGQGSHGGEHRILLPSIKGGGGERKEPCAAGRRKIVLGRPWPPCLRQSAVDAFGIPRAAGALRRELRFSEDRRLPDQSQPTAYSLRDGAFGA